MLGVMAQKLGSRRDTRKPPLATGLPGVHLDIHLRSTYEKFPAVSSSDAMEPNLESVTRRHGCDRVSSDKAGLAEARTVSDRGTRQCKVTVYTQKQNQNQA